MSTRDGQKSHFLTIEQSAYIADAEWDEETGVFEPRIEVLNEGFMFELVASRREDQETLLTWKLTTCQAATPRATVKIAGAFEIEVPELRQTVLQGRSLLRAGQVLALWAPPGISDLDGEAILFISVALVGSPLPR